MMNYSYRQMVILLALVFVGGAGAGGFAVSLYKTKTVVAAPKAWRDRYVSDLRKRLQLTEPQVTRLNGILDGTKSRYDAVKTRYKPEMEQIHSEQVTSIRAMLEPAQAGDYDKFRAERELEKQKQRNSGGK